MIRPLTASVLALSIALGSLTVTPARAGNDDIGRFVAGALTLLIIGKAIQDSKKPRGNVSRSTSRPSTYPSHKPRRFNKKLPEECFFRVRSPNGPRGVFGKICLKETMRHAKHLPQNCQDTVRVRYGLRAEVYGAKCLRNHGYRKVAQLY